MKVNVVCFGILKDLLGWQQRSVALAEHASVRDLLSTFQVGDEAVWEALAVAVNDEYVRGEAILHEGDEVALLPPVSGGAR